MKTKAKGKGISATKRNYLIDLGLSLAFLATFSQEITGNTIHEWLGMGLLIGVTVHLLLHWKWVVGVTKRFFSGKLSGKVKWNYFVNGGLGAAFLLMGITGMMISEAVLPAMGFSNPIGFGLRIWEGLHEASSGLTVAFLGAHLLLHLKWIMRQSRLMFVRS